MIEWILAGVAALLLATREDNKTVQVEVTSADREPEDDYEERQWIVNWIKLTCQQACDDLELHYCPSSVKISDNGKRQYYKSPREQVYKHCWNDPIRKHLNAYSDCYDYKSEEYYNDTHFELELSLAYTKGCYNNVPYDLQQEVKNLCNKYRAKLAEWNEENSR